MSGIVARSIASSLAKPRIEYALAVVGNDSDDLVGYGAETVRRLLGLAFEELNLHRVWGARAFLNQASARTMASVGMVEDGVIREHIQRGGRWRDSAVHSMLQHEWCKEAG